MTKIRVIIIYEYICTWCSSNMRHSKDLRKQVLECLAEGNSQAETARRFDLSRTTVRIWSKQPEGHEAKKPGPRGSHKFDRAELARLVQEHPYLTLRELAQHFAVSINAISHALKCMNIPRKRNYATGSRYPNPRIRDDS